MTLAEMKLMLKVGGWRLRSKSSIQEGSRNHRSWYVEDEKGDLRSRYHESAWDAAEWGIASMAKDEAKLKQILDLYRWRSIEKVRDIMKAKYGYTDDEIK